MKRKQRKSLPWRMFGYVILIIIKFIEVLLWFSPRIINTLRSYVKNSKECFNRYPNTSKLVKKTRLRHVFSTNFLVFRYLMKHSSACLIYYINTSLTRRAHFLINANHRMERFSKNNPWSIFNKVKSSSVTLSKENRHSFRICLANERCFHIKSFSSERFCAVYTSLTAGFVIPKKGLNIPQNGLFFTLWNSPSLICMLFAAGRKIEALSLSAPSTFILHLHTYIYIHLLKLPLQGLSATIY